MLFKWRGLRQQEVGTFSVAAFIEDLFYLHKEIKVRVCSFYTASLRASLCIIYALLKQI